MRPKHIQELIVSVALFFLLFITSASLVGCASTIRRVEPSSAGERHLYEKNYTLHNKQRVSVGEPLIIMRDYYVEKRRLPVLEASQDFSTKICGHSDGQYSKGQRYNIIGSIDYNQQPYYLIQATDWAMLVDTEGYIKYGGRQVGYSEFGVGLCAVGFEPPSAKLNLVFDEIVSHREGYLNYEFLYNGIDKNSMIFTYREFSPEGIARVAFYQTLTYDSQAKTIRFKKFKLEIIEASSEGVTYSVVED